MTLLVDATTAEHARGIGTVISGILGELPRAGRSAVIVAAGPSLAGLSGGEMRRVSLARTRPGRILYQRLLLPLDVALLSRTRPLIDRVLLLDSYVPLLRPQKDVRYGALVHDLLPLTHPQFWPPTKRTLKRTALASLRRAQATVFTSTDYNAQRIRQLLGMNARVVRFGCGQLQDAEADEVLDAPLPPRERHLLYVGAFEERKDVIGLIGIFEQARRDLGFDLDLVLVGEGRGPYVEALEDRIARSPFSNRIRLVQRASVTTTLQLMRSAQSLILPSLAEGFGLPILEALALGTPVVASDLPEIRSWAGNTILYAAPTRPLEWVEPIATALSSGPRRRRSGQEFAKQYRWRVCAREISNF